MPSNYLKDDPIFGRLDLDDVYITDAWLIDQFVGNQLFVWGAADSGQLGLGDTVNRSSPVQVGTLTNWKQVNVDGHTACIKTDGTLWTWGENFAGALGLGDIVRKSSPVQVGTLTNWKQVSVGGNHMACVKTDGTLWTWGSNLGGQLGLGDIVHRSSPVQVGTLTNWKQVSAGSTNYVACIKTDGTLWTWGLGLNSAGQLGLGDIASRSSPVQVGSLTNWKQVNAGDNHTSCIKTDGTLWTWGFNTNGELGLGDIVHRSSPVQVGSLTNWKQISTGFSHTACIKTDGTLWTWGLNSAGQLGLGDIASRSSPVQVGSLTNWKQVSCGYSAGTHTACVKTDGTLWTWGGNGTGRLGLGDVVDRSSPVQVGTLTNWKQVSLGAGFTLCVTFTDIV
jgi:alpha-tubulin suppressor-like RCC1 family protein